MGWRRTRVLPHPSGEGEQVPGYRDLRRIGRGGFSVIYRATQERFDREVALKVLAVEFIDARIRHGFLREVQLTSKLTGHPNVVTVLDTGMTASGRPYIAMEYFSRGSLADRLTAEGPLPLADVLRVGVKIAGALAAAHELGMVHRDVKPQNILISRYGEPVLADFGTARLTAGFELTQRTEAFTTYHSAPEILRGDSTDFTCDIYSLGSTLYHLLAGRPAFPDSGDGLAGLLLRVVSQDPPPIQRPDVPAPVLDVVRKAMAKQPGDRFPDALSFAAALRELQTDPEPATGTVPVTPVPKGPETVGHEAVIAPAAPLAPTLPEQDPDRDRTLETGSGRPPGEDPPVPAAAEEPDAPPPSRRPAFVAVAALAVVAAAVPLLFTGSRGSGRPATVGTVATVGTGATPPASTSISRSAPAPSPTIDLAAARPFALNAVDKGASVYLTWKLPAAATGIIDFVTTAPGGPPQAQPLSSGVTSFQVTGLNPVTGYCFQVGVVVQLAPTATAWSQPYCIRNATPGP